MDLGTFVTASSITAFTEVLLIDLVLAGDNAIVVGALAAGLLAQWRDAAFVVDAAAMTGLKDISGADSLCAGRAVLTPHRNEMAKLMDADAAQIEASPETFSRIATERWNRLHPFEPWRVPFVTRQLERAAGPVIAVSDFVRAVPDQVSRWVPSRFTSLGTDGYGRSDTREHLRRHFEVDTGHVVVAALSALMTEGTVTADQVKDAIARYGVDPEAADPLWS